MRQEKVALRRIEAFERSFGKPHLYLAYHAAFPLALTPELMYRLWTKFQQDIHGELLNIPWEAVADILLCGLCEEVGYELYEMNGAVRKELLRRLKADKKFCDENSNQDRILELSDFLLVYVENKLHSDDIDMRDFAEAQQWIALAYAQPSKAVEHIAKAFRQLQLDSSGLNSTNKTEIIRLASVIETFAEPLAEAKLEPLLIYARGLASFARAKLEDATTQLSQVIVQGKIQVAGEELPIPAQIKAPVGQDFSGKKLRGRSFKGQDLTGANFTRADLRGANFANAKLVGANFNQSRMGLQRRWAIALMLCCFLLLLLSSAAAASLGALWGTTLTYLVPAQLSLTSILSGMDVVSLVVFAVSCIAYRRRGWQSALLAGLVITLLSSPVALLCGMFLNFDSLRPSSTDWLAVGSGGLGVFLFTLCCLGAARRGVGAAWIAAALAWVGTAFLTMAVALGVSMIWNFFSTMPAEVPLVAVGVAVGLAFAFAYFSRNSRVRIPRQVALGLGKLSVSFKSIRISWVLAIILSLALAITQYFSTADITVAVAVAEIALVLALVLIYESARPETTLARMFVLALAFSVATTAIASGIAWVVASTPAIEQIAILFFALPVALIVAMFLILAGAINLAGAIAGIGSSLAIAAFLATVFAAGVWVNNTAVSLNWLSDTLFGIFLAGITVVAVAVAWATAVIIAVGIAVTWAESGNQVIALVWAALIAGTALVQAVGIEFLSQAPKVVIAGTITLGLATIQLGVYIAWLAIAGNPKFAAIRNSALVFATAGGTNFLRADLTNADFTQARLKGANFRQAYLNLTRWFQATQLERACGSSDTYLQYPNVQQLLTSGDGQNQNFDGLDLRRINLREANLAGASFVNTNLSAANLQGADLSRAKLLHTNLDGTNLAIAQLTGAYIQGCELTSATRLESVECDYIYTQVPTTDNPDPKRIPSTHTQVFKPGEFARVWRKLAAGDRPPASPTLLVQG